MVGDGQVKELRRLLSSDKSLAFSAAAIDRLVHHSVIIELNVPSYRIETAKKSKASASSEMA